jgi:acyl-CoA thioester hydrolase
MMKDLPKIVESRMKIRFHDCDPFNHLNNSKYIDYIMTARGDQLVDNYDFDIYKLAKEDGIGWVTAQTQISYLAPAMPTEEVIVQTRLLGYSDKSLQLEAIMWNTGKTTAKAVMWAKMVHYNLRTQRSHTHDERLMSFFSQVANPFPAMVSFEERTKSVKAGA